MKLMISNRLHLSEMSDSLRQAVCERLIFPNPAYLEAEKMGRWTGKIPRLLRFYEQAAGGLIVPRGFVRQVINLSRQQGEPFQIDDRRRTPPEVEFSFRGILKAFQQEAVDAILKRDFGTLSSSTGSGKTVMALAIIAERRQPALIMVHTRELLNQWVARIGAFLGIPAGEVGIIGNGKKRIGDRITVALVQSLYRCAEEVSPQIGHLVVDESHRAPSRTFTEAVTAFDSRYMLGLSATPWRRDRLSRLIFWHLGDVVHEVDSSVLVETGDILRAEVVTRQTAFRPNADPVNEYSRMLSELTEDPERNRLIASDVAREASNGGGISLVLSDRKAHCEALRRILTDDFGIGVEVLTGDTPGADRQGIVDRLNRGEVKVLVATGQLIGEGFDCRELSTLFMGTPIKFSGRVLQYLGRVLRPAPGKDKAKVYDYIDPVGVLMAAAKSRARVYGQTQPCQPVSTGVVNHG